ncbi:Methylase involved in ubiquinone/menaquinone biosynthesis [Paenibacillus uliginis N3/975]|uniref:Methylase involved in ubiquinone/menaquinone biosynthesis n=1 Tax=Paenibacillus uliginis N3/975 TaxID=1313296 RepID=A0A1X7HMC9_9BACL|nr:class I SAM-dependent methyltransferase [Paenibacillus uliginis]SMF89369.1 Methylase involved in ubiquinone/menaquinone biosynthesis [Paenibacillus uliginis N3/975]
MTEWYEESFGEDYLLVYKHRDAQGAAHEVQKMASWLRLPAGAKVLDLCCGMGRHSLALSEAGYHVTGIDLSDVLLREARQLDQDKAVTWIASDMRHLPVEDNEFDAVLNLFTSFGYFTRDEEHIKVLQQIYRVLKPDGQFIIDFLNPAYVEQNLVPESSREFEGQRIDERRKIENGYVKKEITITDLSGGETRHYNERVKLYTYDAFKSMVEEVGLYIEQVHGSYDDEKYDPETSPRMIFFGRRPAEQR